MSRTFSTSLNSGVVAKYDPAPQLRPAGKVFPLEEGGVRADITQRALSQSNRVETPNGVKPFRRSHAMSLGESTKHYGFRNDGERDRNAVYGYKNRKDASVDECLNPDTHADKMNSLAAEHAEKRYLSHRKEPLGRVPDPSIPIPERLMRDGFGVPTEASESAKVVIYNTADKEAKLLHPPGEQKSRNYDWSSVKIDPTLHRFGAVVRGNPVTTKELVHPQLGAHVLPKIVRDFQTVNDPELGKTRNLGFGSRQQGADFTYGKTLERDGLNARQLITGVAVQEAGGYAEEDSEYNRLGGTYVKSATQRKLRSVDKRSVLESQTFGGGERPLGVPSIRTDIPKPDEASRKITNGVNYGDDVSAKHLLYPNTYIGNGILGKYYSEGKSLEEIRTLADKLHFGLTDVQVEEAFARAAVNGKASAEDFKNAANELGF